MNAIDGNVNNIIVEESWLSKTFIAPYRGANRYTQFCGVVCGAMSIELISRVAFNLFSAAITGPSGIAEVVDTLSLEIAAGAYMTFVTAKKIPALTELTGTGLFISGVATPIEYSPYIVLKCFSFFRFAYDIVEKVVLKVFEHFIIPLSKTAPSLIGKVLFGVALPTNVYWVAIVTIAVIGATYYGGRYMYNRIQET